MSIEDKKVIEYFDWNYFWLPEKSKKQIEINEKAVFFEKKYPNIIQNIINVFSENFSDWKIADFNSFINESRSAIFEVNINDTLFFINLSIFNCFLVKEIKGEPGNYDYYFINEGENENIDNIYNAVIKKLYNNDFRWLPRDILNLEIKEFNLGTHELMKKDVVNVPIYFSELLASR